MTWFLFAIALPVSFLPLLLSKRHLIQPETDAERWARLEFDRSLKERISQRERTAAQEKLRREFYAKLALGSVVPEKGSRPPEPPVDNETWPWRVPVTSKREARPLEQVGERIPVETLQRIWDDLQPVLAVHPWNRQQLIREFQDRTANPPPWHEVNFERQRLLALSMQPPVDESRCFV